MNLDLTGLADIAGPSAGEPLMLLLDLVSCDPSQPRKYFDEAALKELSESIRAIGVVQPISVRPDPEAPGRYIINYGERRFLASIIAGMATIPVFVHKAPDDYMQVAENLHRADLSPMEMALFIKRRLDVGEKKNEIAAKLGYKNGYVTEHLALLEAPPCVEKAYANGATSARTLYDLRRLHDDFPQEVDAWCASGVEVTRDTVAALVQKFRRDEVSDGASAAQTSPGAVDAADVPEQLSAQKFRRDEISDGASAAQTSSTAVDPTDAPEQPSAQKFRRDEILGVSAAHTSPAIDGVADVPTQLSTKSKVSLSLPVEAPTAPISPQREKRPACVRQADQESAKLFIRVAHDGRMGTVQDNSLVLVRFDDGGTVEVSLAKLVVLGTAAA